MKNIFITTTMSLSLTAIAAPDFSALDRAPEFSEHGEKIQECIKTGWQAATPSEEQNKAAGEFLIKARVVVKENMPAIKKAGRGIWMEYAKHPIDKTGVDTAEAKLQVPVKLVRTAVRDAVIDSLNLLSAEQREAYNTAFINCMKQ